MAKVFNREIVLNGDLRPRSKNGTAVGGAVTIDRRSGIVTTASLTTAADAVYTLTITNKHIKAGSIVLCTVSTTGTGLPILSEITPADGSVVITIHNNHASAAFNAVLKISFFAIRPSLID